MKQKTKTTTEIQLPDEFLTVVCCVDVINKRLLEFEDVGKSVEAIDRFAAADDVDDDVIVYGVDCTRNCSAILGFEIFGDHTAQGNNPTMRNPSDGFASECVCEVIFTSIN